MPGTIRIRHKAGNRNRINNLMNTLPDPEVEPDSKLHREKTFLTSMLVNDDILFAESPSKDSTAKKGKYDI